MRQVVLDTETTGLSHEQGHRLIEIGCLEMENRILTGRTYHMYLNPDRLVDEGAFRVHGISDAFLADKPRFSAIVSDFINFIDGSELIIHNAAFDIGFLNAELARMDWPKRIADYAGVLDTLLLARKKHPGRNNLDALCKRYQIDNTHRTYHGALLDAEILARVYLAMTGGQRSIFPEEAVLAVSDQTPEQSHIEVLKTVTPIIQPADEERQRHLAFLSRFLD